MRIGLVGYGHGGRFFHAPLISSLPAATFVGVVTRSPERRQLLAAEHPGVPAFDSIGQLVEAGIDVLGCRRRSRGARRWCSTASNTAWRWLATSRLPPMRSKRKP